jgi:hypothetical protein
VRALRVVIVAIGLSSYSFHSRPNRVFIELLTQFDAPRPSPSRAILATDYPQVHRKVTKLQQYDGGLSL